MTDNPAAIAPLIEASILTQNVLVRYNPDKGRGTYMHENPDCPNFAFHPGDKVIELPILVGLLAGTSPCGQCLHEKLATAAKHAMSLAIGNAKDPSPKAGHAPIPKPVVTAAPASEAGGAEVVNLDADTEDPQGDENDSDDGESPQDDAQP